LVDDIDLTFLHHVFFIALIQTECAQQLTDAVNAFASLLEGRFGDLLGLLLRLIRELFVLIDLNELSR
jgi:hypothetical protein